MFPLFLQLPIKDPRPKWYGLFGSRTFQTIYSKKCLPVILEFCPLSVVCSAPAAYTNLCRGQKYLLKVMYISLIYPIVTHFLIYETLCLGRTKMIFLCLKIMNGISAECVSLIHTFWYFNLPDVTARYGMPFDFITFFWVFSYILDDHTRLNFCVSTKLWLISCILIHTHTYIQTNTTSRSLLLFI